MGKTKPIQSQSNPIPEMAKMNLTCYLTTIYEQSTMNYEIKNKPNFSPIPLHLLQLSTAGSHGRIFIFLKILFGKCHLPVAFLSDTIFYIQQRTYSTENADYWQWRMQRGNKAQNNFSRLFNFITAKCNHLLNL